MSFYRYAQDSNGSIILNDIPNNLLNDLLNTHTISEIKTVLLNEKKTKVRCGNKSNNYGEIFILTTEVKYVKSNKLFKQVIDINLSGLKSMIDFQNQITLKQNSRIEELIHNLTSLNAHSIQDLFTLFPQQLLTENLYTQEEIIKEIISKKPNVTSKTVLQLIKYNLAMKVEFSVFDKTSKQSSNIQKSQYPIRDLFNSIIQIFVSDFDKKNITIHLSSSEKRLSLEYDTIFVSLYYILENATKYCKNNSTLKIFFNEEAKYFSIKFDMISIRIEPKDIEHLCDKNYRSNNAIKLNTKGQGIGMFRVNKTLKRNNATIEVKPRHTDFSQKSGKNIYEHNMIEIKFPGQQDWFT